MGTPVRVHTAFLRFTNRIDPGPGEDRLLKSELCSKTKTSVTSCLCLLHADIKWKEKNSVDERLS